MDSDIFSAGTAPGSPTTQDEIKMLLCYILSNIGQSMSFAELHEAFSEHGYVNYFELVRALEKLTASGHLSLEREPGFPDRYAATPVGQEAAGEFCGSLPRSVREKSLDAARKLLRRNRREAEVTVEVKPADGGFLLELAIPESGCDLLRVEVFAPNREQAELLRRRFLNDPQFIYQGFLALLTGDEEAVGKIFPQKERLF